MTPNRPPAAAWPACNTRAQPRQTQGRVAAWSLRLMACLLWLFGPSGLAHAGTLPGELPGFVGRLSTLQGEVRWFDRDSAAWLGSDQQPLRNWPLAAGDRLRTGHDARAELRVGGTTVRLGADVDLSLQQLDENRLELRLQSGTLALRLPSAVAGDTAAVEVVTPEGRWLPLRPGHYRLERQADARTPATQATVWRGELRFEGPDSVLLIPTGRRADLWQDRDRGPTRYAWAAVERDAFADWVARDERGDDAPVTARHVPPGMTGWQDLDRHGDWVASPDYGSVWQPRVVAPGWAPFHDGRWAWVAPWGWTWIDAAPWGFAPFHYGSWVMLSGRWCWSPGPRHVSPRFAPVHPGWVSGPQVSIGIQIGGGHRPPPPRVVIPVAPPAPIVVVVRPPPPAGPGPGHRPPLVGAVPQPRPGDRPGGRRPDEREEHRPDADRGRPGWQPGREQGERRDRPERGDRGAGPDRPDRPDRHHWAEPVDRKPVTPAMPLAPAALPAPTAAPALPIKPATAPGHGADAPRTEAPRTDASERRERPDRTDGAPRGHRQDALAWR